MCKSIFFSLLMALSVFELKSIKAIPYLDSVENVTEDSDTLDFNNSIDNVNDQVLDEIKIDLHPINTSLVLSEDGEKGIDNLITEPPQCSSIALNFSNMNFGPTVHAYIINGSYIQNLSLPHNNIEEFDNGAFDGLSNLKYLDLSYNKLHPKKMLSFGGHDTLETLIFDYNKPVQRTEYYYDNWGNYRQRSTIDTSPITVPTSNIYPKLKSLSLRGTGVTPSFDNWNQNFPSLEKLDLSYINLENVINSEFFKSIPSTVKILILQNTNLKHGYINNLFGVEELDVSGNFFTSITVIFGLLPDLKKLNLSNNELVKIPSYLLPISPNMEELNLSGNRIEIIESHALEVFKKLKVLKLSNNPLKSIDFIQTLSRLDTLILDDMQNSKIIESLDTLNSPEYELELKYLSIKNNNLTKLPDNVIKSLNFLEEIDLSGNYLSSLPNFSPTLTRLNLRNNNIKYLDDALLRSLSNLKEIKLGNNTMKQLEIELISKLPKSCILNWE